MPSDLERTAYHEAGHFVASRALELDDTHSISIIPDDERGTAGHAVTDSMERWVDERENPSPEKRKKLVVSLCAGFAAQRRFDPDEPEDNARAGAEDDFQKARLWGDALDLEQGLLEAHTLVTDHWATVEIVARALLIRKKLDGQEAEAGIAVVEGSYDHASWILHHEYGWSDDDVAALTAMPFG
ncbi:MAG TPA: hypothetical protein VHO06_26635 [Polyangia bacterium]|nr:hypothetical protein [Polyangia bacterium]